MSDVGKRLSILFIDCSQEVAEITISEMGLTDWQSDTCTDALSALEVVRGQKHYDLILTNYEATAPDETGLLQQIYSLDHRRNTPVVMIARKAEPGRKMSKRGKRRAPGRRNHGLTDKMKAFATSALAQKVGYLRVEDFPDAGLFDDLPTKTYSPNRIIRSQDELLLVKRGLVEVWHTHHDLLVKKLTIGSLFGDMPLLGQTMVVAQAVSGPAGAMVAVMNTDRVRELIKANADSLAEKLYPRLASLDTEHYRAIFQKADSRVAALLLKLAGEGSTVEGVKQSQLGERIGLVRETVAVVLGSMKADKLITIDRKKTTILDREALEKLSLL